MAVKRVVFIRPGETDWNLSKRFQGLLAIPLNEHGRAQARQLTKYVRNLGLSALYTSNLRRARETAEILAEQLGFAPIVDERLRERHVGIWQGLTAAEMQAWYLQEYARLQSVPQDSQIPGGETRGEVQERMSKAFNDIINHEQGDVVGILSHTSAINILLRSLIPNVAEHEATISNTSVTTIRRVVDGQWQLVAVDDVSHLEGMQTSYVPSPGGKI